MKCPKLKLLLTHFLGSFGLGRVTWAGYPAGAHLEADEVGGEEDGGEGRQPQQVRDVQPREEGPLGSGLGGKRW